MKKSALVLAVLVSSLVFAGCDEMCENGFKLKNDVHGLRMALEPPNPINGLDASCAWLGQNGGHQILSDGANFMESVAYQEFYWEDSVCRDGYWSRDPWCGSHAGDWHDYEHRHRRRHRHRHRHCHDEYVCTDRVTIPHRKPGFEEARAVAENLRNVHASLNWACVKHKAGETAVALPFALDVKYRLIGAVRDDGERVLRAAGCYK